MTNLNEDVCFIPGRSEPFKILYLDNDRDVYCCMNATGDVEFVKTGSITKSSMIFGYAQVHGDTFMGKHETILNTRKSNEL